MKKLLITLLCAASLSACQKECAHGYSGSKCEETWSSAFARSWVGTIDCGNGTSTVIGTITAETATRIRIDGRIYGELDSPTHFDIPEQSYVYNGNTYTVYGSGQISDGQLAMGHTTTNQGQTVFCSFRMN